MAISLHLRSRLAAWRWQVRTARQRQRAARTWKYTFVSECVQQIEQQRSSYIL